MSIATYISMSVSIYLCLCTYLPIYPSIYPSFFLSIHLCICAFMCVYTAARRVPPSRSMRNPARVAFASSRLAPTLALKKRVPFTCALSDTCGSVRGKGKGPGKVDVRLSGEGDSNSHGARPVRQIIEWIRTSRLSIMISLSRG